MVHALLRCVLVNSLGDHHKTNAVCRADHGAEHTYNQYSSSSCCAQHTFTYIYHFSNTHTRHRCRFFCVPRTVYARLPQSAVHATLWKRPCIDVFWWWKSIVDTLATLHKYHGETFHKQFASLPCYSSDALCMSYKPDVCLASYWKRLSPFPRRMNASAEYTYVDATATEC